MREGERRGERERESGRERERDRGESYSKTGRRWSQRARECEALQAFNGMEHPSHLKGQGGRGRLLALGARVGGLPGLQGPGVPTVPRQRALLGGELSDRRDQVREAELSARREQIRGEGPGQMIGLPPPII